MTRAAPKHDCAKAGCSDVERRVHAERIAQGLPVRITDPTAIGKAASVVRMAAGRKAAS